MNGLVWAGSANQLKDSSSEARKQRGREGGRNVDTVNGDIEGET